MKQTGRIEESDMDKLSIPKVPETSKKKLAKDMRTLNQQRSCILNGTSVQEFLKNRKTKVDEKLAASIAKSTKSAITLPKAVKIPKDKGINKRKNELENKENSEVMSPKKTKSTKSATKILGKVDTNIPETPIPYEVACSSLPNYDHLFPGVEKLDLENLFKSLTFPQAKQTL